MDLIIGLIGVLTGVAIPIYLHFKSHPRRKIRYAVMPVGPGPLPETSEWRVALWSSGRADIPSASFDSSRPVVLRFSTAIDVLEATITGGLIKNFRLEPPGALVFPAQLLRQEFRAEARLSLSGGFDVTVENPIIGVQILRDQKAETPVVARQEQAVQRSKKRSRITFLRFAKWLTIASFVMFVLGISLTLAGLGAGPGIGIPGMLLTPIGLLLLAIAGIRRMVIGRLSRSAA